MCDSGGLPSVLVPANVLAAYVLGLSLLQCAAHCGTLLTSCIERFLDKRDHGDPSLYSNETAKQLPYLILLSCTPRFSWVYALRDAAEQL